MKIGLTYTGSPAKHENYVRWLKVDPGVEIIKLEANESSAGSFDDCDALVLSGGIDMDPEFYRGEPTYPGMPLNGFDRRRDNYEWDLFDRAWQKRIPVLGICRGLQLINCFFGGDLVQDSGETGNSIHRSFKVGDKGYDRAHAVDIEENTLLAEIAGIERTVVNSAHHQAIKKLGGGLIVNAYSDDGVIEGIELEKKNGKPFLLAVQWHPERMDGLQLQESPLTKNIRDRFLQEIKSGGA